MFVVILVVLLIALRTTAEVRKWLKLFRGTATFGQVLLNNDKKQIPAHERPQKQFYNRKRF